MTGGGVSNPLPEGLKVAVYGNDGSTYLILKVDSTGRLKVVTDTSALPTGAATEETLAKVATDTKLETVWVQLAALNARDFATQTTLVELRDELALKANLTETQPVSAAALPLPTGASTAAHQVTMITAMQLIDDLRTTLHTVGTDQLDVHVHASVLPTGAATLAKQTTIEAVLDKLLMELAVGGNYRDAFASVNVSSGSWTDLTSIMVGTGKIHHIKSWLVSALTATTTFELRLYRGGSVRFHMLVESNPFVSPLGWYLTQTAGNTWKISVLQTSGGNVWINSMVQYLEVPA